MGLLLFIRHERGDMKLKYNKEDDVLIVEYSKDRIDDAFESNNMLVHVNSAQEPVLIEIFKASEFLRATSKVLPKDVKTRLFL